MGWRFIEQPNGLIARFSSIVDDFTHYHMTDADVLEMAFSEFNIGKDTCEQKLSTCHANGKEWWDDAIRIVRSVHGKQIADSRVAVMSAPPEDDDDGEWVTTSM